MRIAARAMRAARELHNTPADRACTRRLQARGILREVSSGLKRAERRGVLMIAAPYPAGPDPPSRQASVPGRSRMACGRRPRVTVVCAGPPERPATTTASASCRRAISTWRPMRAGSGSSCASCAPRAATGGTGRTGLAREIAVRLASPTVTWSGCPRRSGQRVASERTRASSAAGRSPPHLVARAVVGDRPWLVDCNDLWSRNPDRTNGRLRDAIDDSSSTASCAAQPG